MSASSLKRLNDRTITINLVIGDRQVQLRGAGHWEQPAASGRVLRIHVADPAGDFDILLEQGRFSGPICEDETLGDVQISLEAADLCAHS